MATGTNGIATVADLEEVGISVEGSSDKCVTLNELMLAGGVLKQTSSTYTSDQCIMYEDVMIDNKAHILVNVPSGATLTGIVSLYAVETTLATNNKNFLGSTPSYGTVSINLDTWGEYYLKVVATVSSDDPSKFYSWQLRTKDGRTLSPNPRGIFASKLNTIFSKGGSYSLSYDAQSGVIQPI